MMIFFNMTNWPIPLSSFTFPVSVFQILPDGSKNQEPSDGTSSLNNQQPGVNPDKKII